ncbi:MAG TPA: methyltransferase domain-containing protein [Pyrinomonadaceae bacterium]|jgi:ubiquinone/menaquinone biosynthesis C-methylase UbiE
MATENSPAQAGAVIEHFDKLSANRDWSRLYASADGNNYHFHVRRDRVLALLPEKLGRVLDLGCGPGVMTEVVLERGGVFDGVDLSPEMISEAKEKFGHLPNVNFATGNIEAIDAADNSYDQLICMAVTEYLQTPDRALSEIARVLKPGGIAIITTPKRWTISRVIVAATKPVRVLAKLFGAATADHLPRLRLQPQELDDAARRAGLIADGGSQYHYTPFAYPLTRVAPGLMMRLNMPFERFHADRGAFVSFWAHGYVGRYKKASG